MKDMMMMKWINKDICIFVPFELGFGTIPSWLKECENAYKCFGMVHMFSNTLIT